MKRSGWGNYPRVESRALRFGHEDALRGIIHRLDGLIPFGNGRSYGDSALSRNIIDIRPYGYFLDFDESCGLLRVQSGVLLSEILEAFVPRGWFLKITPGTKLITVGGAIASDVHGKNHHVDGCFSQSVQELNLMLPDGRVITCSHQENTELFRATCGGMGLTGVILDAAISLIRIRSSTIDQVTVRTSGLEETFDAFEAFRKWRYSVAWIDCLATGRRTGQSLLMAGDFSDDGNLDYHPGKQVEVPLYFPPFALNSWTVRAFNCLYHKKVRARISCQRVDIDTFFYPLDSIRDWNRIYGRRGFTQYQFVLPEDTSFKGLTEVLSLLSRSGRGSFLAVLKACGEANDNLLSFPMKGYSLALDFKIEPGVFTLLDRLDEIVVRHGGRLYLAKDVRVSSSVFEKGYPEINRFRDLRKEFSMCEKFNSLQSIRVGI